MDEAGKGAVGRESRVHFVCLCPIEGLILLDEFLK